MIKRFIIALVLVVLICGGLIGFNIFRDQAIQQFFANQQRPTVTISATEVEPVTWQPGIDAVGTVLAARGVELAVETAGVVKSIGFAANDEVETGKVLVQLDDAVEQADLVAARSGATLAQQNLERAQQLRQRGVGAAVNVEQTEATADEARSRVQRLEAVLAQKSIEAPFAGVIGIPRLDVGQYVTPGTNVATLQDLDTMQVDFTVPEQNLSQVRTGQTVSFGFTEDELPFTGTVTGIDPKIDPETRLISVRAEVENDDGKLRPGQFVRVRLALPEEDDVIALPQTAVVSSLYGDFVYVVEEGERPQTAPAPEAAPAGGAAAQEAPAEDQAAAPAGPYLVARQVFVQSGRRFDGRIEIVEGVEAGARVVTAGQNKLSTGTPVAIDNTIDPATLLSQRN